MPEQIHRLFFALRPDLRVAGEIERAAADIKVAWRMRGRWVKARNYHLTVHFLGSHAGQPTDVIERARTASAQLKIAPFRIALDRVETFAGHKRLPCVLRCTAESETVLRALRSALGEALKAAGLAELLEDRFTPHVTVAYVDQPVAEPVAVAPIVWQVREFALLISHAGDPLHELLDHWPLARQR